MLTIPALDLLDGQVVRLFRGDYDAVTTYPEPATAYARRYATAGFQALHLVDLAAARDGRRSESAQIRAVVDAFSGPVQCGGGIRTLTDAQALLDAGCARLVVGTALAQDPTALALWARTLGADRLILAADIDDEQRVATDGWTRAAGPVSALLDAACAAGVRRILCTVIARDGAMRGPDVGTYRRYAQRWAALDFIASGGVRDPADLNDLAQAGAAAAVVGKALLTAADISAFPPVVASDRAAETSS